MEGMRGIARIVLTAGVTLGLAVPATPALADTANAHVIAGSGTTRQWVTDSHRHHRDHHFGIGHKVG
jgi:hypothetical protein